MAVKFTDAGLLDGWDDDGPQEPTFEEIEIDRLGYELYLATHEIVRLTTEVEHLRSMSSSGFARATIKLAPKLNWDRKPETEDFH